MIGRAILGSLAMLLASTLAEGCAGQASAAGPCGDRCGVAADYCLSGGSCASADCASGPCHAGSRVFRPDAHEFSERGPVRRIIRDRRPVRRVLRGTVRSLGRLIPRYCR